jgi:hypothetical protein
MSTCESGRAGHEDLHKELSSFAGASCAMRL